MHIWELPWLAGAIASSDQVSTPGAVDVAYHDDGCCDISVVQLPASGLWMVAGYGDCDSQSSADSQPELEAILHLPAGHGGTPPQAFA